MADPSCLQASHCFPLEAGLLGLDQYPWLNGYLNSQKMGKFRTERRGFEDGRFRGGWMINGGEVFASAVHENNQGGRNYQLEG